MSGTAPLGKLGMAPIIDADCTASPAKNDLFFGDPGSIFLIKCDTNCDTRPGILIGTGIYRDDSSMC
jgi:hypothetical protein